MGASNNRLQRTVRCAATPLNLGVGSTATSLISRFGSAAPAVGRQTKNS
jgi:hypothetical protein